MKKFIPILLLLALAPAAHAAPPKDLTVKQTTIIDYVPKRTVFVCRIGWWIFVLR